MADLTPGRDLDERVAVAIGCGPQQREAWWATLAEWSIVSEATRERAKRGPLYTGPRFSTSREAAMTLLDELAGRGWEWSVECTPNEAEGRRYAATVWDSRTPSGWCYAPGLTLPLAVCAAVLDALEPEEDA